jgi:biotin carboxyl carrier protein
MFAEPFRLRVNDRYEFEMLPEEAKVLDLVRNADGSFHIIRDGRAYTATLLEADPTERTYVFSIGGDKYRIHIADHYERLIQQLGLSVGGTQKQNTIKAPMPGLVLQVSVEVGQSVQKGDTLLILEAMKMENVIKAAGDAVIKHIHAKQGAAVEKGQLLLEME